MVSTYEDFFVRVHSTGQLNKTNGMIVRSWKRGEKEDWIEVPEPEFFRGQIAMDEEKRSVVVAGYQYRADQTEVAYICYVGNDKDHVLHTRRLYKIPKPKDQSPRLKLDNLYGD